MGNFSSEITSALAKRDAGTNFVSLNEDLKFLKSPEFRRLNEELSRNFEFQNKRKLQDNVSSSFERQDILKLPGANSLYGNLSRAVNNKKSETFSSFEEWIGRVEEISNSDRLFHAVLQSKDHGDEIASFSFDDVSEDDIDLLKVGAVFYWNVGQAKDESGRISNVSIVRFRRLQHWKRKYLEEKFNAADEKYSDWL